MGVLEKLALATPLGAFRIGRVNSVYLGGNLLIWDVPPI